MLCLCYFLFVLQETIANSMDHQQRVINRSNGDALSVFSKTVFILFLLYKATSTDYQQRLINIFNSDVLSCLQDNTNKINGKRFIHRDALLTYMKLSHIISHTFTSQCQPDRSSTAAHKNIHSRCDALYIVNFQSLFLLDKMPTQRDHQQRLISRFPAIP